MPAPCHGALVVLVLLSGTMASAREPFDAAPGNTRRRIELSALPMGGRPEIHIRPGLATLLLFDTRLVREQVELEGRERFSRVAISEDTLTLIPSEALREGEHLRLTVRFAGETLPSHMDFVLVVSTTSADSQVEVLRAPRPDTPAPMTPPSTVEELQRLRAENARLRSQHGPEGITRLLAAELMHEQGILVRPLDKPWPHCQGAPLHLNGAVSFRSSQRVALLLKVRPSGTERPWAAGEAVLRPASGPAPRIVQVWQSEPGAGAPSSDLRLVVEAEATNKEAHGSFTLELKEAGGDRTLICGPVTFPAL